MDPPVNESKGEMWKLIFWRAPLKVLIFCDWDKYEKKTEKRRVLLSKKLSKLKNIIDTANQRYLEADKTEYLFIIGNRELDQGEINWKWASNN